MRRFRIGVTTLLIAILLSACGSGYRQGPAIYTSVGVGSPYWGHGGYGYGYPAHVGGGGNPDIDLPPENLPSPPPQAVTLPSMGMPSGGFDEGGFDGGGFDGGGFDAY